MVDAVGEAAYAGVWMGGCSRETTWACDSETLALEAFVNVVHCAAVRRMAGLADKTELRTRTQLQIIMRQSFPRKLGISTNQRPNKA